MGTFRSRGAARKESSLKALFSRTGVPRIEELKDSSVTSQVTPGAGTGVSYLGQEVAMRGRNQCKIPSQQLRNFSKEFVFTEMGLLGHVTCGEHLGNSLRAHLGQDTWGITGMANTQHTCYHCSFLAHGRHC